MIAAWMLHAVLVTGALAIAGVALDLVVRTRGLPTRHGWAAVVVLATVLPLAAPLATRTRAGTSHEGRSSGGVASDVTDRADPAPSAPATGEPRRAGPPPSGDVAGALGRAVQDVVTGVALPLTPRHLRALALLDRPLTIAWGALSTLGLVLLAGSLLHVRRLARTLTPALVDGTPVLLSRELGPALLGVVRHHVVLPRWALSLSAEERALVLTHEREHARAHDPALLVTGAVALVLQPWNPALWFVVAHLRFATEVDCDQRVLGARGDLRRYGTLLLALQERILPKPAPVAAFVEPSTHLDRRIRRMTDARHHRPRLASPAGTLALVSLIAAGATALALRLPAQPPASSPARPTRPAAVPAIVPMAQRQPEAVRAAGAEDFEPLVRLNYDRLFAGLPLPPVRRDSALAVIRRVQRERWERMGQGVASDARTRRTSRASVPLDSLLALDDRRDVALRSLLTTDAERARFDQQAAAWREERYRPMRGDGR